MNEDLRRREREMAADFDASGEYRILDQLVELKFA